MDTQSGPPQGSIGVYRGFGYDVITSKSAPYGDVLVDRQNKRVYCRPTNDLVWDSIWENFIRGQRRAGKLFISSLFADLSARLGLYVPPQSPAQASREAAQARFLLSDMASASIDGSDFRSQPDTPAPW